MKLGKGFIPCQAEGSRHKFTMFDARRKGRDGERNTKVIQPVRREISAR